MFLLKMLLVLFLGGHGDDMVPLVRYSYAGGIPLEKLIPARSFRSNCCNVLVKVAEKLLIY